MIAIFIYHLGVYKQLIRKDEQTNRRTDRQTYSSSLPRVQVLRPSPWEQTGVPCSNAPPLTHLTEVI